MIETHREGLSKKATMCDAWERGNGTPRTTEWPWAVTCEHCIRVGNMFDEEAVEEFHKTLDEHEAVMWDAMMKGGLGEPWAMHNIRAGRLGVLLNNKPPRIKAGEWVEIEMPDGEIVKQSMDVGQEPDGYTILFKHDRDGSIHLGQPFRMTVEPQLVEGATGQPALCSRCGHDYHRVPVQQRCGVPVASDMHTVGQLGCGCLG